MDQANNQVALDLGNAAATGEAAQRTQTLYRSLVDHLPDNVMAVVDQAVADVVHECRNALQQMQACTDLLKWTVGRSDETHKIFADLQQAQDRLRRVVDDLAGLPDQREIQ
jgi:hypothetical protein